MPKLYIANTTKQDHEFVYRVPGDASQRLHKQLIPSGGQQMIYREDGLEILGQIVETHARYGLIDVKDIDTTQPFIGCCYSFDKPIKVDQIMRGIDHNDGVLFDRGVEGRKNMTAALHNQMQEQSGGAVRSLELSTIEETKDPTDPDGFQETIEVVNGQPDRPRDAAREPQSRRDKRRGR